MSVEVEFLKDTPNRKKGEKMSCDKDVADSYVKQKIAKFVGAQPKQTRKPSAKK